MTNHINPYIKGGVDLDSYRRKHFPSLPNQKGGSSLGLRVPRYISSLEIDKPGLRNQSMRQLASEMTSDEIKQTRKKILEDLELFLIQLREMNIPEIAIKGYTQRHDSALQILASEERKRG